VISTKNARQILSHQRWNGDVVSFFGVFRDQGIATPNLEFPDLAPICGRFHKVERARNPLIIVNIYIVAESNWHLAFDHVFVHVADEDVGDCV
jgi:hypothetical protein